MQTIAWTSGVPDQIVGTSPPAPTVVAHPPEVLPQAPKTPSDAQINEAIAKANASLKQVTRDLEFVRDADTGKTIVRIVDASTQQVIRQFPSEEMLAIARALDKFEGLLIKREA